MTIAFQSTILLSDGSGAVHVSADLGTQAIGEVTGSPLSSTRPGIVTVKLSNPDGLTLDVDTAINVRDALAVAIDASQRRDASQDKPKTY